MQGIEVLGAPGARTQQSHSSKWLNRLWEPLEHRLRKEPVIRVVGVLHLGANDVECSPDKFKNDIRHLGRDILQIVPDIEVLLSEVLPQCGQFRK